MKDPSRLELGTRSISVAAFGSWMQSWLKIGMIGYNSVALETVDAA